MNWKFTNSSHDVAFRVLDDGTIESVLASIIPDGEIIDTEDEEPIIVPQVVSKFQGKAALLAAGLLSTVETVINSTETDPLVKLAWDNVTEFHRQSPMILALSVPLGLTDEQLDQLFIAANTIIA